MSGIQIKIVASDNKDECFIRATGETIRIISDDDRAKFGITDRDLKDCVGSYFGKNPNDAYVRSPTPWGDLYKSYGWDQVQTHLRAVSATVLEITSEPVALVKQTLTNNSSVEGEFKATLKDTVTETVETNWNTSKNFEFSQSIDVSAEFLGTGISSSTGVSFSDSWGQGGSHSGSASIESGQEVSVVLQPGKSVVAHLNATRGTLKCRVEYEVVLTGHTAVNYDPAYKGHHFWGLDIVGVMRAGGKEIRYKATEDMTVGYYGNGEVVLEDN